MDVFTHMSARTHVAATLLLLAAGAQTAGAQQPDSAAAQDRCNNALVARGITDRPGNPCRALATAIVDAKTATAWLDPRDIQPSGAGNATPAGTPAQSSAVPSVQPTAVAAAAIAALAQDSGADAITSISINPGTLFTSTNDKETLARLARLTDFTVFFPVSGLDQNKDGKVDYAGVRTRINFTAGSQASTLLESVNQRFIAILQSERAMARSMAAVLMKAPDPAMCTQELTGEKTVAGGVVAACGTEPSLIVDPAIYQAFRQAAAAAREEADAKYLGLDLRFDYGDPSLGKVRNASGTALQGGFAFGRTFNPSAVHTTSGLRGRLGVRYVTLRDTALSDFQVDGGVAFETARVMQSQRLELSAGFEFRYSGKQESNEILRTRYAEFRAAANVPLANSTSVALSLSAPLMGDISPTLSISGNWQQLIAGLLAGR